VKDLINNGNKCQLKDFQTINELVIGFVDGGQEIHILPHEIKGLD